MQETQACPLGSQARDSPHPAQEAQGVTGSRAGWWPARRDPSPRAPGLRQPPTQCVCLSCQSVLPGFSTQDGTWPSAATGRTHPESRATSVAAPPGQFQGRACIGSGHELPEGSLALATVRPLHVLPLGPGLAISRAQRGSGRHRKKQKRLWLVSLSGDPAVLGETQRPWLRATTRRTEARPGIGGPWPSDGSSPRPRSPSLPRLLPVQNKGFPAPHPPNDWFLSEASKLLPGSSKGVCPSPPCTSVVWGALPPT